MKYSMIMTNNHEYYNYILSPLSVNEREFPHLPPFGDTIQCTFASVCV